MRRKNNRRRRFIIVLLLALVISTVTFYICSANSITQSNVQVNTNQAQETIPVQTTTPPPAQSLSSKIDEYMKVYENKGWFSGTILIAKKGDVVISKGYGRANYEEDVPNTPHTKFHLGSVTKQFTAMCIMQLQEKGLLNVNDTLSKYIPDYPNGKSITIHQLLTHTSGIPDYINDDDSFGNVCRYPHTIEQVIEMFKSKPLEFKPGTKYDYSNSGYVLLSYIIEKVSKMSYENFLNENIFKPLNMKNTGYDHVTPIIKNRALGYSISSDKLTNADFFDRSNLQGADGLYSTVEDLFLWDRSLYTGKLVSKATLDKIFTPYPPATTYGYGWTTDKVEARHFGRMDGFYTFISRNMGEDTTIIVLSNIQQAPLNIIARDLILIASLKEVKAPTDLTQIKME